MDFVEEKLHEGKEHLKELAQNFPENAAGWTGEKVCADPAQQDKIMPETKKKANHPLL